MQRYCFENNIAVLFISFYQCVSFQFSFFMFSISQFHFSVWVVFKSPQTVPSTVRVPLVSAGPDLQWYSPVSSSVNIWMVSWALVASCFMLYLSDGDRGNWPLNQLTSLGGAENLQLSRAALFSFAFTSFRGSATSSGRSTQERKVSH